MIFLSLPHFASIPWLKIEESCREVRPGIKWVKKGTSWTALSSAGKANSEQQKK